MLCVTSIMMETIGGYTFETESICSISAPPYFNDGFGQRFRSMDPTVAFNDWFRNHRTLIREYIHHWGLLVIDGVQVDYEPQWQSMRIDPEFNYLPWHSDGFGGEQSLLLAHIPANSPRKVPTLVAPSVQIYLALREALLAESDRLYPVTRDAIKRVCEQDRASITFFEGLFLHFQHASRREQCVFKEIFEHCHEVSAPWLYRHQWRLNSVMLLDTAHYGVEANNSGFNRVVHGRMPIVGESLRGVQPYRWLV